MKFFYLLSVIFLFAVYSNAQIVNIPDTNFKAALIAHNPVIDTDSDGEIQVSEAVAYDGTIYVSSNFISDLTGIEEFINIIGLRCDYNYLTSLDISNNTALTSLSCDYNGLTSLDISNNTSLTYLICSANQLTSLDISNNIELITLECSSNHLINLDISTNTDLINLNYGFNQITNLDISDKIDLISLNCTSNQITSLDVSNNTALTTLYCYSNQLTTLDISNNTELEYLNCQNNQITSLDLSNNTVFTHLFCSSNQLTSLDIRNGNNTNEANINFQADNNPNLTCIQVDDSTYSTNNWTVIDSWAHFSEDCSYIGVEEPNLLLEFDIYPNPFNNQFTVSVPTEINTKNTKLYIYDIVGKRIELSTIKQANSFVVNTVRLKLGIYFVVLKDNGNIVGKAKIVKE